jgi:DNA topoisomerase II
MAPKAKKASKGSDAGAGGKKEDLTKWQKKTPIEHILLRPDSYVGSTEASTEKLWLFNSSKGRMELKTVTFVPAM